MKRNSKRFLALFLSVAMTITPAVLTQAEDKEAGVQLTLTPAAEEASKTDGENAKEKDNTTQTNEAVKEEDTTKTDEAAKEEDAAKTDEAVKEEDATQADEAVKEETSSQPEDSKEGIAVTQAPATEAAAGNEVEAYTQVDDLKEDGSNMTIDKADDTAYKMFLIASSSAELKGDKIKVTLTSSGKNYNKLYIGHKEDAASEMDANAIQGVETEAGYTFVFEIPASEQAQTIYLVPHSTKKNSWYITQDLKLNVPGMKAPAPTQAPEVTEAPAPTQTPEATEAPQPTQAPDVTEAPQPTQTPEPTQSPDSSANEIKDAGIKLVKEDGNEFAMFVITGSTVKLNGDKYTVALSTAKQNYDMIYFGSASDDNKEEQAIRGTENEAGGYTYTFEVPASKETQTVSVVPHSKKSQNWYSKGILSITIPAVPGYGEQPEITPAPTQTPQPSEAPNPSETPDPTGTPNPSEAPNPTEAPQPSGTPAPSETPAPTAAPEPTKVPSGVCENGIYNVDVTSSSSMFRVVGCTLTSKNGKMTAVLTLSGTGYDYLFAGTGEQAAKADSSKWIPYTVNADGKYTYEIPVESLDQGLSVAAFSHKRQTWYDRTLTFESATLNKIGDIKDDTPKPDTTPAPTVTPSVELTGTPTPTPTAAVTATPTPNPEPDKESKYDSDLSGGTSSVNSSTTLADGTYTPDSFSWSGGTGKVSISCNKITVTGGKAYATIVFSSEYYGYVKANGNTYYGSCGGGTSTFTIPIALNQNNTIIGMTTRMSQAHEITYTIYAALKGASDPKKTDKENPADENSMLSTGNKKLDESAPEITGLEYKDETKLEHAKYFKLYNYAKGITLFEVDMTADTARKPETADSKEAAEDKDASASEKLYTGNVIKYLIVPEGAVIPAGLDKDVILIQKPVESVYVASEGALNILDELGLTDKITSLGLEKDEVTSDSLTAALEDGSVSFAGKYDDTDYKELVKSQCNLAILPSDILPAEETETEEKLETLKDMAAKYATLKIPFIIDRSADEENEAAKAEWTKAYQAIFTETDEEA